MRTRPYLSRLVLLATVAVMATHCFAVPAQLGVSYSAWENDLTDPANAAMLAASLDDMADMGVKWVALNVFWFQADRNATTIAPDYTKWSTQPASIDKAVAEFKARGINVVLKPMVDIDGDWRGNIPGADAWFDNPGGYKDFVGFWADEATRLGVDGLSVGCEFKASVGNQTKWREVIDVARSKFSGPLTYSANWDNFQNIGWWDALDEIGIDAYFPLTPFDDPSLAQLEAAWASWANGIEGWLGATNPGMPVVFSEIGYRSLDGANKAPYAWEPYNTSNVDLQEQAECYFAAMNQTWTREWMDGYYWWIWETNPAAGIDAGSGLPMNDYTPQNKPAQWVMRAFYVPEPLSLSLLGGGLLALARRRRRATR